MASGNRNGASLRSTAMTPLRLSRGASILVTVVTSAILWAILLVLIVIA